MFRWPLSLSLSPSVIITSSKTQQKIPRPPFDWSVMTSLLHFFCFVFLPPSLIPPEHPPPAQNAPESTPFLLSLPPHSGTITLLRKQKGRKRESRGWAREGVERGIWFSVSRGCVFSTYGAPTRLLDAAKEHQSIIALFEPWSCLIPFRDYINAYSFIVK